MISRIVLVITFISFLFSCTHNEKLLSFDKKNDNIILSPKLKGKIIYIAEKKDNMEYQEDENIIIITKTKYKVTELSMKKNKAYILSIIYRGRGYYLDVYL